MIKEGVRQDPRPDAVFGLHVNSGLLSGRIGYRTGAAMASADELRIKVTGRQGPCRLPLARDRSSDNGRANRARTSDGGEPARRSDEIAPCKIDYTVSDLFQMLDWQRYRALHATMSAGRWRASGGGRSKIAR
jgi:hypothetical protein